MQRISSGSSFEDRVGYARAVVSNGHVFVSATAATGDGGKILHAGDYYGQTKAILQKLERLLADVGSSIDHIVQTKLYVVDIAEWEEVGRAHAEVFSSHRPALTILHVNRFLHPDILVEDELTAEVAHSQPA